jgi:hypothetical protein
MGARAGSGGGRRHRARHPLPRSGRRAVGAGAGLLLIGDAAHVMSPVGGVGINYAIQDAVVAANLLSDRRGRVGSSERPGSGPAPARVAYAPYSGPAVLAGSAAAGPGPRPQSAVHAADCLAGPATSACPARPASAGDRIGHLACQGEDLGAGRGCRGPLSTSGGFGARRSRRSHPPRSAPVAAGHRAEESRRPL